MSRLPTSVRLAAPAVTAALLALSACTSDLPVVEEAGSVVVTVPGGPPVGDLAWPAGVAVTPDGGSTVLLGGPRGDATGLTLVSAAGEVTATLAVPGFAAVYAVAPTATSIAVVGWLPGDDDSPGSLALGSVDPATGGAGPVTLLPTPVGVDRYLTQAVALGDGRLVVAVDRISDQPPVLLLVDPATAAVTAGAEVDLGGVRTSVVDVADLAVTPDGSRVAVGISTYSDRRSGALLATAGTDLQPEGPAIDLAPDEPTAWVETVDVADDGTAYTLAAVGVRLTAQLLAVQPGATSAAVLGDPDEDLLDGESVDLAVTDGAAWVLAELPDGGGTALTRVDLADGEPSDPHVFCDGAAGRLALQEDGGLLVTGRCDGEAQLWELDPR